MNDFSHLPSSLPVKSEPIWNSFEEVGSLESALESADEERSELKTEIEILTERVEKIEEQLADLLERTES